ncbi:MAG: hypothetical protein AAF456_09705 [Planctomycetota bacterium]
MFTFKLDIRFQVFVVAIALAFQVSAAGQDTGQPLMRAQFNGENSLLDQVFDGNDSNAGTPQTNSTTQVAAPGQYQDSPLRNPAGHSPVTGAPDSSQQTQLREPVRNRLDPPMPAGETASPGFQHQGQGTVVQDSNVSPVYFPEASPSPPIATPPRNAAPLSSAGAVDGIEQLNFIERENAGQNYQEEESGEKEKESLPQLISRIGLNLALVLTFASAFIIGARRFMNKTHGQVSSKSGGEKGSLEVKETLTLNNRTTLYLVQWRSNRVLVACDTDGIKSVELLNSSFGQTLSELAGDEPVDTSSPPPVASGREARTTMDREPEQGVDEKIIRMLLQNASKGRNGSKSR